MRYRDAGVDIARAGALKAAIGQAVRATWGRASGRFRAASPVSSPAPNPRTPPATTRARCCWRRPWTASAPKLHLALAAGRVRDAAADLVYHCANDLLAHAARPLAFLDYVAQARLDSEVVQPVVEGLCAACRDVGAAVLGARPPRCRTRTCRGRGRRRLQCRNGAPARLLDGRAVRPGDVVLGLESTGLHTNGYSLRARSSPGRGSGSTRGCRAVGASGSATRCSSRTAGMAEHSCPVLETGESPVHALAHVTGGGIAGNLVRVLPTAAGRGSSPARARRPCFAG